MSKLIFFVDFKTLFSAYLKFIDLSDDKRELILTSSFWVNRGSKIFFFVINNVNFNFVLIFFI